MSRTKVYFVVLHYQVYTVTVNCVLSLLALRQNTSDIAIIIVDNNSPNESGKCLDETFKNENRVTVVYNKRNEGFARGNNKGFAIAKKDNADFIVLINNDTVIKDIEFVNKIKCIYNRNSFGILGPDILSIKDGIHQNPMKGFRVNKIQVNSRIIKTALIRLINKSPFWSIIKRYNNRNKQYNNDYSHECIINSSSKYILHGSCLILSEKFISQYSGLDNRTFMYYEENILAYICERDGIKMMYSPEIQVEHYRNISSNYENKNTRDNVEFFYANASHSLKVLRNILENER